MPETPLQRAINLAGGQARLAQVLGVTAGAVAQWVAGNRPLPPARAAQIANAVDQQVTAVELLPDFPWPGAAAPAKAA